jgi:hypothetical protein
MHVHSSEAGIQLFDADIGVLAMATDRTAHDSGCAAVLGQWHPNAGD